jgi:hypothetical protein
VPVNKATRGGRAERSCRSARAHNPVTCILLGQLLGPSPLFSLVLACRPSITLTPSMCSGVDIATLQRPSARRSVFF